MTRTMKDSGVEWIGEVPEQWILAKLKYNCSGFQNGSSQTQLNSDISNYPVTRIETISTGKIDFDKVGYVENINNNYLLKKNDFLISNINSIANLGNNAIFDSDRPLYHGMNLLKITPKFVYPKFLYYYFNSGIFRTNMQILCKPAINQASVSASNIKNIKMPFPPLPEQQAIADYLDYKCAQIDNITTTINEQIEVLKQYKKSVITEAVTKGLDPNVPMKDSGVEWIGQIPETWEVGRIKHYFKMVNGATPTSTISEFWDGEIIWITPADMNDDGIIKTGKRNITNEGFQSCGTNLVPTGSIIISTRAPIGKINIAQNPLCTNQGCKSLVSRKNNKYYYYYLISKKHILEFLGRGTTFLELSGFDLNNFNIPVPSSSEQQAIANYLDNKCTKIDAVIVDKQAQLETLAAYKKSLIYEYVTGKKSVPGFEEA